MERTYESTETLYLAFGNKKIRLGDLTFIGRSSDNDIVLEDPYVSRKHCMIEKVLGRYIIADRGSSNGTFLNGRCVSDDDMVLLGPGDEIRIGNTIFLME
ncbi:MAG: FHA domain-containing protein [Treponema sp.]|nr:FHA domain-containing protein [Treponema sp.]